MNLENFFSKLNIIKQCRKYNLSILQCPQFLFLLMGIVIIVSSLLSYAVGRKYVEDPSLVLIMVMMVTVILLIIAVIITRSFERMAEANRLKTEFVSIVSHQLRSPLSNLKWVIELLISGRVAAVSEKQAEYFKVLRDNNERMKDLVSDLLTVSRIEQGRFPIEKEKIDFKRLIDGILKDLRIFSEASNVKINIKSQNELPKIFADPKQIKIVATNLLENAIRYIDKEGAVNVNISKKGKSVLFEVSDNGVGVPKEDQKYLFQKFFRSKNALRRQTEGSGLGLYIAKSIIENSGGKIGFKSQEGVGSTFWFSLPVK